MKFFRFLGIFVGVGLLAILLHRLGLERLKQSLNLLGGSAIWILLSPLTWDCLNTLGVRAAFPGGLRGMPFLRLFEIRIVGETFNALIPSGYMGGEPLKIKFLHTNLPLSQATSSVLIAKVAHSLSLVLFLVCGLTWTRPLQSAASQRATLVALISLTVGVLLFAFVIALGSFAAFARRLDQWTGQNWLSAHQGRLAALDQSLNFFFKNERGRFLASFGWHLSGWFVAGMEVAVIFYFLGHPISWRWGWFIAAIAQLGSSIALAVPAGIGFFEGGHYLAAGLLGISPELGLAVGVIRRVRETVWYGVGVLFFWHLSKQKAKSMET